MRRLLVVFLVLIVFAAFVAALGILISGGSAPMMVGHRVLTWRIAEPLVDYHEGPAFSLFHHGGPSGLAEIYEGLERARVDDHIEGLALYIQDARFGFGKAQELRSQLRSLIDAGKFVDCYLETAGEGTNGTLAYYLATACQRITFSPLGDWNVVGLYSDSPFIRGTLDKLRIQPDFMHVGDYKSAAEFYTESEHSEAAEVALGAVLDDLFDQIVAAVAEAREISPDEVRDLIDRAPLTADEALDLGLIDEITYPDIFEERIEDRSGTSHQGLLPLEDYLVSADRLGGQRVAVVFAQGTIVRGGNGTDPWSQQRYVGADSMREILRNLTDDDGVLGVVLRIDSPGGSPIASDLILRELELLAEKKPLVVSMSDVAASGGYYIAAKAARIVAEPATITGSIGVVGGKLATRTFQQELLGVSHDSLQRGANADFYSALDPFTPAQGEQFLAQMTRIYDIFVDHVATGRQMSRDDVLAIAGGRIWTGRQAREIGLVDEIGGLGRAIDVVLELAGHETDTKVKLDLYPRAPTFLEMLSQSFSPFFQTRSQFSWLPPLIRPPLALEVPLELLELFGIG